MVRCERVRDRNDRPDRGWIGNIRCARWGFVFGNFDSPVTLTRVVNEESAVCRVLRVKGQAEQAAFAAAAANDARNIEKISKGRLPGLDHANDPALLDDKHPVRPIFGICDMNRRR